MRVIAGVAKGSKLYTLSGDNITRPTTDRAKQKLFDTLQNICCRKEKVLDLFAGSGALGIEALSRGAAFVDFVDKDRRAADIVRRNLDKTHLSQKSKIHVMDAFLYLKKSNKQYDLIFADPPYNSDYIQHLIRLVATHEILSQDGILILEEASEVKIEIIEGLALLQQKVTGYTTHYFIQKTLHLK